MGVLNERLEEARRAVQGRWGQDLRQWWAALQGEDYQCSYSAARNYHRAGREPPASYLARVCEVHGVAPTWLLLGERPVLQEQGSDRRIIRALEEHHAEVEDVLNLLREEAS